ncbi:type II secretion system inner membrane protein GspF [Alteromonas macleodii]|jgi:general secretion pathway protein F|uniref:General secretion pathway protein F n=1 Tax=Alteromonas macleodii (strain English Channel 673) TaxID=1004788 RepID=A0AB33A3H4_ALTME|nr:MULTISPECIES: type II secretion system inner membrane protein GspF [Alteromonas]MCG8497800.1 type II secretion system inner membrane protein GspF [Enterobacterales bacterium]MEC7080890.1 type II secretion system inner membrane protein GspF [Pseudomonadota bacterium]AFT76465.1 general secretion pathway protein F [Alteromonas macleodii str. 'English Channel 673']AUI84303.1 type II secretion system protein GspF [Alteromonas macleodii]MBC6984234.1 type II secretion system inner membrane protein|tara:strand:+ start:1232 stop:2458 length:1227 start_codon:yes stop_codon:yes gene_type:complete
MAAFAFKAVNARGKNTNGVLEGDNARQVRQQLREKGLIPLEVEQVAERAQSEGKGLSFSLFKPRISASDLALLTRQLATLVESALPVEEALLAVAEQCEKPRQKNMMMAVRSKVVEGHGLADALGQFPSVFDELYRAMVAAGEKSGHLDTVLNRLADYTERRQQTRSQITQAMIYPSLMLFFAMGIVLLLLTVVVPKIVGQFDHMGQDLPAITQFLISVSTWLQNYGLFMLIGIAVLVVIIQRVLQQKHMKLRYHRALLTLPLIGRVSRGLNTARFARTLSILSASAVPLLEAMRISGDVLENQHIKNQVADAAINVKEGSSLRAALDNTKMFPPMMMHMIASGEKSGELQQMLARAADNQDREFEALIGVSLKVFEPLLIVSMAGIVLFIVMAILQPILALNNMVNI